MERLQKIIANFGYCSRRKAEELILKGKVKVDGKVVTTLGQKFSSKAEIKINNILLKSNNEKIYIMWNKPRNVISSLSDPQHRKSISYYIKNLPVRVYPVGRLDYDTSGLLLLTNDGDFANFIMHPRHTITKTYHVLAKGFLNKSQLEKLQSGIIIDDDFVTKPAQIKVLRFLDETEQTVVEIKIWEGKNHQVKKMFLAINSEVIKLKRVAIDFLNIDSNLKTGEWRYLKPNEIKKMLQLKNNNVNNFLKEGE